MGKRVTVKLNRKNVREQLLFGEGTEKLLMSAAESAAPADTRVEASRSFGAGGRVRVRIVDDSASAVDDEAKSGKLTNALGRVVIP